MSLLSTCQAAAGASGFAVPSTIVGNSDRTATLLLRLINKAGKRLAHLPWNVLQKEFTFNTANGTANYAAPSDLGFYQDQTIWDRTQYWQLRGSLSAQEWQIYKSGVQTTTPRNRFRIKGAQIYIDPTPAAIHAMVIEYISNQWVTDGSSFFTAFTTDAQTSLLSEDLLELELTWRFLERKGLAYDEAKAEADDEIDRVFARDIPKNSINVGTSLSEVWPPLPTVPVTGYSGS